MVLRPGFRVSTTLLTHRISYMSKFLRLRLLKLGVPAGTAECDGAKKSSSICQNPEPVVSRRRNMVVSKMYSNNPIFSIGISLGESDPRLVNRGEVLLF